MRQTFSGLANISTGSAPMLIRAFAWACITAAGAPVVALLPAPLAPMGISALPTLGHVDTLLLNRRESGRPMTVKVPMIFWGKRHWRKDHCALVVSLWPVVDESTALLMESFYETFGLIRRR